MVFRPLDGWTSNHVLRLWYCRKFGHALGVYARRVLAPGSRLLSGSGVVAVTLGYVRKASKRWREDIVVCSCRLCPLFLQRAHEALWILDCSMLELFQRLQIALALLALYLQQRYCGA